MKRNSSTTTFSFLARLAFCIIDQDMPHRLRTDRVEVRFASPIDLLMIDQLENCFVHQVRRLERVSRRASAEVLAGKTTEVVVDDLEEAIEAGPVARTNSGQYPGRF